MKRHWLDASRIRFYSALTLGCFLLFALGLFRYSNIVTPTGYAITSDSTVFWTVARLALSGHGSSVYDEQVLHSAVQMVDPGIAGTFGWFYPPTFTLLILPLGWLSHAGAYFAFMITTLLSYCSVVYRILPSRVTLWALVGFSGVWVNLRFGQNGFLTATLIGAALYWLGARPILAGVLMGLLASKPHMAVLCPLALVAIGAWKALATAALTVGILAVAAIGLLGMESFLVWPQGMETARMLIDGQSSPYWVNMVSVFSSLKLLGVPTPWAYAVHAGVAGLAIWAMWKIWKSATDAATRNASFCMATLLTSPYMMVYDLTWLAVSVAWMVNMSQKSNWMRGEREFMVLAWGLPFLTLASARTVLFPVAPLVLIGLMGLIYRSVFRGCRQHGEPRTRG